MRLPKESATFSSCRFNFFQGILIPNSRYKQLKQLHKLEFSTQYQNLVQYKADVQEIGVCAYRKAAHTA